MRSARASLLVLAALTACGPRDVVTTRSPPATPDAGSDAAVASTASVAPGLRLPDGVSPLAYDVRLEVDPDKESFSGRVEIRTRLVRAVSVIWLHAVDLEIASARIRSGGQIAVAIPTAPTQDQMIGLQLSAPLGPGEVVLEIEFTGHTSRDQEGLFRQKVGGAWFLYSQGQAVLARRILPCFDEPRFKVPWTVTLVVPGDLAALGNAPQTSEKRLPDGRREVAFAPIGPLPSYLLAIAVGPFTLVDGGTVGRNKTPVRVAVWPSDAKRVATAIKVLPKIVTELEAYLDRPLPWPKLDLVAVPVLFGAMENVGLVTFESSILIGDDREQDFVPRFIRIAGHEIAHQWMGNLVTPQWWDELWLSEAFATFLGDKVTLALSGHDDPLLRTQLARRDALAADATTKRALRGSITTSADADDLFDEITYEKGGAVLEMFEHIVGPELFRTIVRELVRQNADGWVTTEKLVEIVRHLARPEVAASLEQYATHRGTPVVELTLQCEKTAAVIAKARDGVTIPVCVRYPLPAGATAQTCGIAGALTAIPLTGATCPPWIIGNLDGRGYYQTTGSGSRMLPPIATAGIAERLAIGDDIAGGVRRGEVTIADAARVVRTFVASKDPYAQLAGLSIAREIDPIVDDLQRPAWTAWLAAELKPRLRSAALFAPRKPVELEVRDAVIELVSAHADRVALVRARAIVDAELAGRGRSEQLALALAIAAPREGAALFDRIIKLALTTRYPVLTAALLEALGSFGPALARKVVETALDRRFPSPPIISALVAMLDRPATRTATWRAIRERLPELMARLAGVEARPLVDGLGALCDPQARLEVATAFGPREADVFRGREALAVALAAIDACVARQAAAGDIPAALPR